MGRTNRRLIRIARAILKDDGEAEEAVQETYLHAFTHLEGLVEVASLSAWLARVAANQALMRLRRRHPMTELSEVSEQDLEIGISNQSAPDSVEETAACLGLRQETVKTRFHRATRGLRRSPSAQLHAALKEAFPFAGARCDRIVARVCAELGLVERACTKARCRSPSSPDVKPRCRSFCC